LAQERVAQDLGGKSAFHDHASAAAVRVAGVTMSVKLVQRAAEAAMDRAAERLAVRAGYGGQAWTAIPLADKAHRHGADRCASHHGQDDAA
jgi:hypothetical protein